MMMIQEQNFSAEYQPEASALVFQGRFRLSDLSPSYKTLEQFCAQVIEHEPAELALNLSQIQDMNETSINLFMRLVKRIHDLKKSRLVVHLDPQKYRQGRLYMILQKMFPELSLELV